MGAGVCEYPGRIAVKLAHDGDGPRDRACFIFALLGGRGNGAANAKVLGLEKRWRNEYPGAFSKLELLADITHMEGRLRATKADWDQENLFKLERSGADFVRCLAIQTRDNTAKRARFHKGYEELFIANDRYGFIQTRSSGEVAFHVDKIAVDRTIVFASADYYALRYLNALMGFEVTLRALTSDPEFAVSNITALSGDDQDLVKLEFDFAPTNRRSPYRYDHGEARSLVGWFVLEPKRSWAVRSSKTKVAFENGLTIDRSCTIQYADVIRDVPLPKCVVAEFEYKNEAPSRIECHFDRIEEHSTDKRRF
jgi:hypothetical protein